jgi:hypothetical protein
LTAPTPSQPLTFDEHLEHLASLLLPNPAALHVEEQAEEMAQEIRTLWRVLQCLKLPPSVQKQQIKHQIQELERQLHVVWQ